MDARDDSTTAYHSGFHSRSWIKLTGAHLHFTPAQWAIDWPSLLQNDTSFFVLMFDQMLFDAQITTNRKVRHAMH